MSDMSITAEPARGDPIATRHSTAFVCGGTLVCAVALALELAGTSLPPGAVLPGLAFVALVAGLPHGALDPWIAHRAGLWRGIGGFLRWHALYVGIAIGVVLAFLFVPALALFGFLALSVHHFSGDWNGEEAGREALPRGLRWVAAALIIVVPSVAHPEAVADIFAAITRTPPPAGPIELPYGVMLPTIWAVSGIVAAAFLVERRAGVELAVVVSLAVVLPPLGFFLAYFAGLHSPRHMLRERDAVTGGRQALGVAAYTLLGLAICVGVALFVFADEVESARWLTGPDMLRAVFIGLAALTLPHALLVEHASKGR